MTGRPTPGFPNDSTLPLLAAFVFALAFLGIVVAIGLSDGGDSAPAAAATTPITTTPADDALPQVTLTIGTAGEGKGTVRLVGEPQICTTECSFKIDPDNSVTVIARAEKGSTFVSWTGDCDGGRFCTLTTLNSQPLTATALFALKTPPPEETPAVPECSDGIDNDADGFVDGEDDDCLLGETESPADPSQTLPDTTTTAPVYTTPQPQPPVVPPPVVPPPPRPPPPPPPPQPLPPPPPPEPLPPPVDTSPP